MRQPGGNSATTGLLFLAGLLVIAFLMTFLMRIAEHQAGQQAGQR